MCFGQRSHFWLTEQQPSQATNNPGVRRRGAFLPRIDACIPARHNFSTACRQLNAYDAEQRITMSELPAKSGSSRHSFPLSLLPSLPLLLQQSLPLNIILHRSSFEEAWISKHTTCRLPQQRTHPTNRDLVSPRLMEAADGGSREQKENSKRR